ncbi:MAG: hypothetical protein OXG10_06500 [Candidatus Dadabacteria bacterium]|nr:hypothetical protein [Candidatus Dadabacteria bacterium]
MRIEPIENNKDTRGMPRAQSNRKGLIYLLRLYPYDRFKVGFTATEKTLARRINGFKTVVPEIELLGKWPALEKWESLARFIIYSELSIEKASVEYAHADWSRVAGGEVVDNRDADDLLDRAEYIFSKLLTIEDEQSGNETLQVVKQTNGHNT